MAHHGSHSFKQKMNLGLSSAILRSTPEIAGWLFARLVSVCVTETEYLVSGLFMCGLCCPLPSPVSHFHSSPCKTCLWYGVHESVILCWLFFIATRSHMASPVDTKHRIEDLGLQNASTTSNETVSLWFHPMKVSDRSMFFIPLQSLWKPPEIMLIPLPGPAFQEADSACAKAAAFTPKCRPGSMVVPPKSWPFAIGKPPISLRTNGHDLGGSSLFEVA